jgi:uncharacterized protein (TIGR02271 family)
VPLPSLSDEQVVIPLVHESLTVSKRAREKSRIVIHLIPKNHKRILDVPLADEQVHVRRVPVGRFVEKAMPPRQQGDVTIIPVYEEVLIVSKRLRLKEELLITRRKSVRHARREVMLRTERAEIRRSQSSERGQA